MQIKTAISNFNAIEEGNTLTHDTRSISKIFKNLFSNVAKSLLTKLLKPPDKYSLKSVIRYYSSFAITADYCLIGTTEKQIFKIIQNIKVFKAAGVDKLLERFLRDGADILAKSVSALCSLSISRRIFPNAC